jgi:hypothetical protein
VSPPPLANGISRMAMSDMSEYVRREISKAGVRTPRSFSAFQPQQGPGRAEAGPRGTANTSTDSVRLRVLLACSVSCRDFYLLCAAVLIPTAGSTCLTVPASIGGTGRDCKACTGLAIQMSSTYM